MEEQMWNRFGKKTILYFTGYKDSRVPSMEKELKRVGLYDAERQWQFPSPLDRLLLRKINHIPCVERGGYFNLSMGHYRAIATAYHLGYENVLVIEDDARFLNDVSELEKIVTSLPDDYDVALFDSLFRSFKENRVNANTMECWRRDRKVNEFWSEFDQLHSMACYALSRIGMERMMFAFEAVETAPKIGKMRICDHFLDRNILGKNMKMYFARKNACIQRRFSSSTSSMDDITSKYISMGLNLDEYAEA